MIKNAIGIIVIVFLQFNIIFAQNLFEVEGIYSLTSEKLVHNNNSIFSSQLFHSYGINGKKIFKSNVFIQGGFHLKNFGTKVNTEHIIIDDISEEVGGKSIDIPINIGYYFLNRDKVRLGMSLGMNNSFLINQYQKYYGGVIREDIPVYKDYLFQFNTSVEIGIKLTDHIILNVRPIWQRQINSNYGNYKQSGIGGQLGISYDFN